MKQNCTRKPLSWDLSRFYDAVFSENNFYFVFLNTFVRFYLREFKYDIFLVGDIVGVLAGQSVSFEIFSYIASSAYNTIISEEIWYSRFFNCFKLNYVKNSRKKSRYNFFQVFFRFYCHLFLLHEKLTTLKFLILFFFFCFIDGPASNY